MEVNCHKSIFLAQNIDSSLKQRLISSFNILFINLEEGMKYLGFCLKPNGYKIVDWNWLIEKVDKRINNWTSRWLSLGGRLVLVKVVLQSIPVYWFSLDEGSYLYYSQNPTTYGKFLWRGANKTTGYHLSKWQTIAFPKELGGWGIRNIYWFAKSLAAKSCWRGIFGNSLWSQILKGKYIKGVDLISWIRKGNFKYPIASNFWKNFMSSFHIIKQWLAWQIGNEKQVILGKDPFIGDNSSFNLSETLIQLLNKKGIYSIAQAVDPNTLDNSQYWLNTNQLSLSRELSIEWNNYIAVLKSNGLSLNQSNDKLVWSWNRAVGSIYADLAYQCIANFHIMVIINGGINLSGKLIYQAKLYVSCGYA
jgi:hypothetical protein